MAVQSRTSALLSYPIALLDGVISPSTRQNAYDTALAFAKEQPLLTSFLIPHIILSFLPLALFLSFALGTIILSSIVALLFSLFWVGVALLVLLPVLFITVGLGVCVWIWGVTCWVVGRWALRVLPRATGSTGTTGTVAPSGEKRDINNKGGQGKPLVADWVNSS